MTMCSRPPAPPRVSGWTVAPRGRYTASGPASPTTAIPPDRMWPPLARYGICGTPKEPPPMVPTPGMCVSIEGIPNCRLFHPAMIQLIAERKAFLIPSHIPTVALPIRPGILVKNPTMLFQWLTTYSVASPIGPVRMARIIGQWPLIQPQVADAAPVMAPHEACQILWNQVVLVAIRTMTAISATIPMMIHVVGLADRAALYSH